MNTFKVTPQANLGQSRVQEPLIPGPHVSVWKWKKKLIRRTSTCMDPENFSWWRGCDCYLNLPGGPRHEAEHQSVSFNWKIRNWYWYFSVESFYSIIRSCLNSHYQLFCGSTAKLIINNIILYFTESSCHTRHYEVESTYTVFFYRNTFVKASLVCNCDIVWIFPVYFCHMH